MQFDWATTSGIAGVAGFSCSARTVCVCVCVCVGSWGRPVCESCEEGVEEGGLEGLGEDREGFAGRWCVGGV